MDKYAVPVCFCGYVEVEAGSREEANEKVTEGRHIRLLTPLIGTVTDPHDGESSFNLSRRDRTVLLTEWESKTKSQEE